MITVLHRCRLLQQHIEQSLVGCAEGLDGALILHAILVVGLHGVAVAADDLAGCIVLDLEGLDHQLGGHGASEDDIQNGVAALVGGDDGHADVLASDVTTDEVGEVGLSVLLKYLAFYENVLVCIHVSLPPVAVIEV